MASRSLESRGSWIFCTIPIDCKGSAQRRSVRNIVQHVANSTSTQELLLCCCLKLLEAFNFFLHLQSTRQLINRMACGVCNENEKKWKWKRSNTSFTGRPPAFSFSVSFSFSLSLSFSFSFSFSILITAALTLYYGSSKSTVDQISQNFGSVFELFIEPSEV